MKLKDPKKGLDYSVFRMGPERDLRKGEFGPILESFLSQSSKKRLIY
jgi:hypothetical protein